MGWLAELPESSSPILIIQESKPDLPGNGYGPVGIRTSGGKTRSINAAIQITGGQIDIALSCVPYLPAGDISQVFYFSWSSVDHARIIYCCHFYPHAF